MTDVPCDLRHLLAPKLPLERWVDLLIAQMILHEWDRQEPLSPFKVSAC